MKSIYISILLFLFSVNPTMAAPLQLRIIDEPRVVQVTPDSIATITPIPSASPSDSITPTLSSSPSDSITPTPSSSPSNSVTSTPSSSPSDSVSPTPSASPSDSVTPTPSASPPTGEMISPSPTAVVSPTSSPAPTSVPNNIVATPTDKPTPIQSVSQVVQEAYQPPNPVISSIAKFIIPQNLYKDPAQTSRLSLGIAGLAILFLLSGIFLIDRMSYPFFKLRKIKEIYHYKNKHVAFPMLRHLL